MKFKLINLHKHEIADNIARFMVMHQKPAP